MLMLLKGAILYKNKSVHFQYMALLRSTSPSEIIQIIHEDLLDTVIFWVVPAN